MNMDGSYTKGQLLLLKTVEGSVEGIFHSIDPDHTKLTMMQVIFQPEGREVQGPYHFYSNEVLSVQPLEPGTSTSANKESEAARNYNLMRKVPVPLHPGRDASVVRECDVVKNYNPHQKTGNASSRRRIRNIPDSYLKCYQISQKYTYVENEDILESVVDMLENESLVAVEFIGDSFGYWQKIGLINISTLKAVYLIDLLQLKKVAITINLKKIMESHKITKIVHNCRNIQSQLKEFYDISLYNVFDTQVADLCNMLERFKSLPQTTKSLPDSLALHLGLPESLLFRFKVRDGYVSKDLLPWTRRPLHLMMIDEAVRNAIFLFHLKQKLTPRYSNIFEQGVKIYLNLQYKDPSDVFLVPLEMTELISLRRELDESCQIEN